MLKLLKIAHKKIIRIFSELKTFKKRLADAAEYDKKLREILKPITQIITHHHVESYSNWSGAPPPMGVHPNVPGFAEGGIVTSPTLALIGEAGPEAVVPLGQMGGGVTVNFTQPVFFDREEQMNRFVDMIRSGIQRQDRLRFGGAYSGG